MHKLILLFFIILFKQSIADVKLNPQIPDSVVQTVEDTQTNDFSSFMYQEELFISTNSVNDSIVSKVTEEKRKKRIRAYSLAKLKLVKDSITIDSINIDSIAFIYIDTIYDFNFKVNFLESLPVYNVISNNKDANKANLPEDKTFNAQETIKNAKQLTQDKQPRKEFYVIILIIITLLFAWINLHYKKSIGMYLQAMYNSSVTQRLFVQTSVLIKQINIATFILFILNTSLFIVLMIEILNINLQINNIVLFLIFILLLLILYLIKFLFYKFLGNIFGISKKVGEYYFGTFIYNKVFGIILMPINIILPFIDANIAIFMVESTIILASILFIVKLLKSIFIAINIKFPIVYLILYLCALEILPVLAFVKFIYE